MSVFAVLLATTIGVLSFATADRHTHVYDYSLVMDEDGSFDLVGVCSVDNCESPYFKKTDLSGVKILSAVSPTCTKEGNRVYTYTHDGVTVKYVEKLPTVAHLYEFEIVTQNGIVYLNGKCQAEGCEDPHVFVSNIEEIKLVSSIPGTCFSPRQDTYTYIVNGQANTFVTLVEEDVPHTLNGVAADSLENDKGMYPIGTAGIKLFANESVACGESANGYYICEVCKQVEAVKVVREGHKFLYKEENLVAPTLDTDGSVTLVCHNTECTETQSIVLPAVVTDELLCEFAFVESPATELHPQIVGYVYESEDYGFRFEKYFEIGRALSHDYKYKLEPNNNNTGKLDLVGICSQPECQNPELRTENVPAVFVKDTSTCMTPGYVTWSYDYNGETLYLEVLSFTVSGHSFTYDEEKAIHPSTSKSGMIELYCSTEGCNHSVVVELPKVVVGENAVYVSETEIGTVYEYSYETEYNCTVVLNVIIYKK